jgi:NAD(P)-dependent dehydrogenase (short-subunit alcohol dehydrogenase family)
MIQDGAVWLITGCSKGLGRALADKVLAAGYRVAATARSAEALGDFAPGNSEHVLRLALDVTDGASVAEAVRAAEAKFGAVDVLVNNAGYGYVGAIEEGDEAGVQQLWETNVHGPIRMVKAVLPGMRERGSGFVLNISSVGGLTTFAGYGYYHMSKFALEAMSETLAKEVEPFGVKVIVVEPGAFRTDFRGGSLQASPTELPAYAETVGKARVNIVKAHGTQKGDPERAAAIMLEAVRAENPPLHLALGNDAVDLIRAKLAALEADLAAWEAQSRSTDLTQ